MVCMAGGISKPGRTRWWRWSSGRAGAAAVRSERWPRRWRTPTSSFVTSLNGAFNSWCGAIGGALARLGDSGLLAADADLKQLTTTIFGRDPGRTSAGQDQPRQHAATRRARRCDRATAHAGRSLTGVELVADRRVDRGGPLGAGARPLARLSAVRLTALKRGRGGSSRGGRRRRRRRARRRWPARLPVADEPRRRCEQGLGMHA